jgi:hypothetical protein
VVFVSDEYYDKLLEKVLSHPEVQEYMRATREEVPELTTYELESDALDWFFDLDYDVIFSVNDVYWQVLGAFREKVEWLTSSRENFIREIDFKLEYFVIRELETIRERLEEALKRKHRIKIR